jgi:hypothetical protein
VTDENGLPVLRRKDGWKPLPFSFPDSWHAAAGFGKFFFSDGQNKGGIAPALVG